MLFNIFLTSETVRSLIAPEYSSVGLASFSQTSFQEKNQIDHIQNTGQITKMVWQLGAQSFILLKA